MTFASTWGKPIMKTLNPLGESSILDRSNVARKKGKLHADSSAQA